MAKTEFGQELSSASANSVYLLKTEDDIITGILSLENGGNVNKHISDLQEHLWNIGDIVGFIGENDPNAKIYASTEIIADGDSRKVAIEKLDAQVKINVDNIASNLVLIGNNATAIQDILDSIGQPDGICDLDSNGKIPVARLPDTLLQYQGTWDASTNTPTLSNTDVGVENYWYRCNVAGSVDFGAGSISFNVGDKVVNNGTIWEKWDTTDEVISWNGRTGAVVPQAGDYNATQVGLGNVTNDAQLKRAAGDFDTFTEKVNLVNNDIVLIEDSEDSLNKKKAKLSNLLGGAAGGSFLFELTGDISPIESIYKAISLLDFDKESNMEVLALVTVPESYKAGDQITLENTAFFSSAAADNVFFRCNTTLIQPGDDITGALNEHLSTNSELTLTTANEVKNTGSIDLTSALGEINAVAVAPLDILLIKLFRDNTNETVSANADARLLKFSPSVKYDN
jgi:hypothetical protein